MLIMPMHVQLPPAVRKAVRQEGQKAWDHRVENILKHPDRYEAVAVKSWLIYLAVVEMKPTSPSKVWDDEEEWDEDERLMYWTAFVIRTIWPLVRSERPVTAKDLHNIFHKRREVVRLLLFGSEHQQLELLQTDFIRQPITPIELSDGEEQTVERCIRQFEARDLDQRARETRSRGIYRLKLASGHDLFRNIDFIPQLPTLSQIQTGKYMDRFDYLIKATGDAEKRDLIQHDRYMLLGQAETLTTLGQFARRVLTFFGWLFLAAFGASVLFPFLANLLIYGTLIVGAICVLVAYGLVFHARVRAIHAVEHALDFAMELVREGNSYG